MTTTADRTGRRGRRGTTPPGRAAPPASFGQALVWLAVVVLVVGPFLPLSYASVRSKPYYLPGGVFTLGAYRTLFADPLFWHAVQNTFWFALTTTVLAVAGGVTFALFCGRPTMPPRGPSGPFLLPPPPIP